MPKRIALADAEVVASRVAPPMMLLSKVASPMVWLLRVSSEAVLRALGLTGDRQTTVTEEEVKAMVEEGADAGVFQASERDMIDGVLRLADRPVSAIMTPRIDVVWLDRTADAEQVTQSHHRQERTLPLPGRATATSTPPRASSMPRICWTG